MFIGVILRVLAPLVQRWVAKRNQNAQAGTAQPSQPDQQQVPQPASEPMADGIGFGGGIGARRQRRASRW